MKRLSIRVSENNMKSEASINYKNVYYPPGGILMWIIIFLELITFGIALVAMVSYGNLEPEIFHESRLKLDKTIGVLNTVILITSGCFMAMSVNFLKQEKLNRATLFLKLTMFCGLMFLLLKGLEYADKVEVGLIISYNTFYTFYWMLTIFHVIHVVVGLVILGSIYVSLIKSKIVIEDVEASAAFWHMCDLIWLLLFPIIYLFF